MANFETSTELVWLKTNKTSKRFCEWMTRTMQTCGRSGCNTQFKQKSKLCFQRILKQITVLAATVSHFFGFFCNILLAHFAVNGTGDRVTTFLPGKELFVQDW